MNFIVSTSPHIHSKITTSNIMRDVCIALLPTLIASLVIFGAQALLVTMVCVVAAMGSEYLFEKTCKLPITVQDFSAVVTGLLVAYNLPVTIPLWQAALGSVIAIVLVKQLFGGLGRNFANPAIVGRIILFLSFSKTMTAWQFPDAVSSATPLALMASGNTAALPSLWDMFLGMKGGCLGEVSGLALLLGFAYLLIRRIISWHTPVAFVGTVFLLSWLLDGSPVYALYQILSGGLLLGAIFMATDYVTSPLTKLGQIVYGIGCGIITILIRYFGGYSEGVTYAILCMNACSVLLDKIGRPVKFGAPKKEAAKK